MGTKAQPTNSARSLRPNLLRSGVDGKVTFLLSVGDQTLPARGHSLPVPSKCYAP